MKQVLVRQGRVFVEEVPAPQVEPGTVLVRVDHSCISAGTELSVIRATGEPLWRRALVQPEKVRKVLRMAASQGLRRTGSLVQGRLKAGDPVGYSAAGVVLAVGEGVEDLRVGDAVACAGAQCAHHAEVIRVPRNLTVPVPAGLAFAEASTVALGAIALQGVRRAGPTLGETFVVLGLGILGQLTAQILKANGCRVIGADPHRGRIRQALGLGMDVGVHEDDGDSVEQVARLTDGIGADGVIITAATPSDAVISIAFRMCRRKGRVVLVGDVGLHLNRADFYQKELDFFISTSYGPGRYDRRYEEEGLDYPVAYVRWTENRNMAEYLRLQAERRVTVTPLISKVYSVDEAANAYEALKDEASRPLLVLLSYPRQKTDTAPSALTSNPSARPALPGRIRIAVVGAGGFAKQVHLPNLRALSARYHIQAIVSRSGHNAAAVAKQFGAKYASTDYAEVLRDQEVDAVLIATRHDLHGRMVLQALEAGKHVLVEKPLAVTREELDAIAAFFQGRADAPVLLTGFNRRFSPFARRLKQLVATRSNPMILNYRVNAGHLPPDHWVHGEEGRGRNIGEACHMYDLFTYLTGSRVAAVSAQAITPRTGYYGRQDNFVATVAFEDGSVGVLTYTALGASEFPKERLEVFVDGKVMVLDDYKCLSVAGAGTGGMETGLADKGHWAELEAFADAVQAGGEWPIFLWEQAQALEIALRVEGVLTGAIEIDDSPPVGRPA